MDTMVRKLKSCYNIVLTGAPGTGKTYMARQIAAQMVLGKDDVDIENLNPEEDTVVKERTAFVQFHPSYDYTDFVEGLRPVQKENDVKFERLDGAFKTFCKKAIRLFLKEQIIKEYNCAYNEIKDGALPNIPVGKKGTKDTFFEDGGQWGLTTGTLRTNGKCGDVAYLESIKKLADHNLFSKEHFENFDGKVRDIIGGNDIDIKYVMQYLYSRIENERFGTDVPCVFIIDEINRGELSKIFGELFFSIDPGYRGNKDLCVKTQYQNLITDGTDPFKDGFYVPQNVYIIGTMNDIDRSIESMDFAIRRRFAWVEVKANKNTAMLSKLGDGEAKAKKVMIALNSAIWDDDEKKGIEGLSSAYHIGASYFLKLDHFKESENPFADLWNLHLEGLLREYLRGLDDADEKMKTLEKAYNEAAGIN